MKTKDSIHRFSAAAFLAAAALFSVAFSSCSSDDFTPDPIKEVPSNPGMATINLSFAAPSIQSRADDDFNPYAREFTDEDGYSPVDTEAQEDKVDDLWVYFFSVDNNGNSSLWKAFDIDGSTSADYTSCTKPASITTTETQIINGLNIPQGKYKVYVLANINGYMPKDSNGELIAASNISPASVNNWSASDKAGLEEKLLSYTFTTVNTAHAYENDAEGIICGKLPMAAHYKDIALSNISGSISISNSIINVESGTATITATLTYLCSKVRYTFFFDNTPPTDDDGNAQTAGFSYPINSFEYKVIGVHNAMQNAALFPEKFEGTLDQTLVSKNIIDDPTDQTKGCVASIYPEEDKLADWLDKTKNTSAYKLKALGTAVPTTGQIAYQGMVYLPENKAGKTNNSHDNEIEGTKTCLHLKVELDGVPQDYIINLPDNTTGTNAPYLQQGNFYDIVGRITAKGFEFNVRVKKWVKSVNGAHQGI
ncbi:MAG: hypothetical protein K2J82_10290 [Muribaculaceae bacterium]|nr:hypothetical protein [Muribaculaceae bacterium]